MNVERYECTTSKEVENHEFEINWNVQKTIFQDLIDTNGRQESVHFHTQFYNSSWYLVLQIRANNPDHFGIYLYQEKAEINLTYTFQCLVKNGLKVLNHFTKSLSAYREGPAWGWHEWIKKDELMEDSNWTSDFLIIVCTVKVKAKKETFTKENNQKKFQASDGLLTVDLLGLTQSGLYSDVTLKVGEKKFKAHKGILAARCEYFATMFGSEFKEANENEIVIKDTGAEEFEYVLKFIYSGQFEPSANTAKLLVAADRFALQSLVLECEKYLKENVTLENCLESYEVADLCSRHDLKCKAKEFIKANIVKVMQSDYWKSLKAENVTSLVGIFEAVLQN